MELVQERVSLQKAKILQFYLLKKVSVVSLFFIIIYSCRTEEEEKKREGVAEKKFVHLTERGV